MRPQRSPLSETQSPLFAHLEVPLESTSKIMEVTGLCKSLSVLEWCWLSKEVTSRPVPYNITLEAIYGHSPGLLLLPCPWHIGTYTLSYPLPRCKPET